MTKDNANQLRILSLLKENLNNPDPQVVGLEYIAEVLQLPLSATRLLLLKMNDQGIIISSFEGRFCLITRQGLLKLD